MQEVRILPPQNEADRDWLAGLWLQEWGGTTMVSKGKVHQLADLLVRIAWEGETRIGAATYQIEASDCELLSINAVSEGKGIGTALLAAVEEAAREAGCSRVWLITSNDNLEKRFV